MGRAGFSTRKNPEQLRFRAGDPDRRVTDLDPLSERLKVVPRGRLEITRVPSVLKERDRLIGRGDPVLLNYEGEIAAIVGKPMRDVSEAEVWERLAGFAPANDVGAQDFRDTDAGSMLRVKAQDGFCPIGPGIVRGVDIRQSSVRTYINGKVVQDGPVSDMTFEHRLHHGRPVGAHHLPARRCRADRHARQLPPHAAGRGGRGGGHRRRPTDQHGAVIPAPPRRAQAPERASPPAARSSMPGPRSPRSDDRNTGSPSAARVAIVAPTTLLPQVRGDCRGGPTRARRPAPAQCRRARA